MESSRPWGDHRSPRHLEERCGLGQSGEAAGEETPLQIPRRRSRNASRGTDPPRLARVIRATDGSDPSAYHETSSEVPCPAVASRGSWP